MSVMSTCTSFGKITSALRALYGKTRAEAVAKLTELQRTRRAGVDLTAKPGPSRSG
jgi:hypothetical protein